MKITLSELKQIIREEVQKSKKINHLSERKKQKLLECNLQEKKMLRMLNKINLNEMNYRKALRDLAAAAALISTMGVGAGGPGHSVDSVQNVENLAAAATEEINGYGMSQTKFQNLEDQVVAQQGDTSPESRAAAVEEVIGANGVKEIESAINTVENNLDQLGSIRDYYHNIAAKNISKNPKLAINAEKFASNVNDIMKSISGRAALNLSTSAEFSNDDNTAEKIESIFNISKNTMDYKPVEIKFNYNASNPDQASGQLVKNLDFGAGNVRESFRRGTRQKYLLEEKIKFVFALRRKKIMESFS